MKFAIQYLTDSNGNTKAVQLPINEWEKLLTLLNKFEHALQLKNDLAEAFDQVAELQKSNGPKPSLKAFLNDL